MILLVNVLAYELNCRCIDGIELQRIKKLNGDTTDTTGVQDEALPSNKDNEDIDVPIPPPADTTANEGNYCAVKDLQGKIWRIAIVPHAQDIYPNHEFTKAFSTLKIPFC